MKQEVKAFYRAILPPILLVLIMLGVFLLQTYGGMHLTQYGVQPGKWIGMRGFLFSPFLHGDWEHVLSNSFPILVLGTALFYFFRSIAWELVFWQLLMNGLFLWIMGRPGSVHIGASGLVYSLAFFLLISGFVRRNKGLTMLSFAVIMMYGYLVWGMFPVQPQVSWEGHFAGFLSGIILAFFFRKEGPADDKKKVWDDSDLDGVEPYWEIKSFDPASGLTQDDKKEGKLEDEAKPINIRYFIRDSKDDKKG